MKAAVRFLAVVAVLQLLVMVIIMLWLRSWMWALAGKSDVWAPFF